jgi:hypothetical protein
MVRWDILDKSYSFNKVNDKRIEITIHSVDDKKLLYKHETSKLNGKFSQTVEHSIDLLLI